MDSNAWTAAPKTPATVDFSRLDMTRQLPPVGDDADPSMSSSAAALAFVPDAPFISFQELEGEQPPLPADVLASGDATYLGAWPTALLHALSELSLLHRATNGFGPNYHRSRGFAALLAEALLAPQADVALLRERSLAGCPAIERLPQLAEAFLEGLTLALEAVAALGTGGLESLGEVIGAGATRASVYARVFQIAREVCGSYR